MKKLFLLGLLACAFAGNPEQAEAKSKNVLNFQGTLKDAQEQVVNRSMKMTFKIYDTQTGGTPLWIEDNTVNVKDGFFNVYLGAMQDLEVNFAKELYIEVTLDNGDVLPRTRLTASPFAINAGTASSADTAEVAKSVVDGVLTWTNFKADALKVDGLIKGTFPNDLTIDWDNVKKHSIPNDRIAGGPMLHVTATPGGKAGGDMIGEFPNPRLKNDVIETRHIQPNAVATDKIKNEAVTNSKLAPNAVTTDKIANGEVKTDDIADKNVTLPKLAVGEANQVMVTNAAGTEATWSNDLALPGNLTVNGTTTLNKKLTVAAEGMDVTGDATFANNVTVTGEFAAKGNSVLGTDDSNTITVNGKLAAAPGGEVKANAIEGVIVNTDNIVDNAVTNAKLGDNAVTTDKIFNATIKGEDLAEGAVTTREIADGEVKTADIADLNVTNEKIKDGTISIAKLAKSAGEAGDAGKVLVLDANGVPTYDNLKNKLNIAPVADTKGQVYFWNGTEWKVSKNVEPTDGQLLKYNAGENMLEWKDDQEFAFPLVKEINTFDKAEYNTGAKRESPAIDIKKTNDPDYTGAIMNLVMEGAQGGEAVKISSTGELAHEKGALSVTANAITDVVGISKAMSVAHNTTVKSTDGTVAAEFVNNVKEAVVDKVHKGIDAKVNIENGTLGTAIGVSAMATGGDKPVAVFATDDATAAVDKSAVILAKSKGANALVVEGNTDPGKEYVATFTAPAGSRTVLIEGGADEDATIIGDDIDDKQDAALVVRNTSAGADRTAIKTYGDVWVNSKVRANKVYAYSEIRVGTDDVTTIITPPATADGPVNFDRDIQAPNLKATKNVEATEEIKAGTNITAEGNANVKGNTVLGDDKAVDELTVNATSTFNGDATFNGTTNITIAKVKDLEVEDTAVIGSGDATDKLTVNAGSEFQKLVTVGTNTTAANVDIVNGDLLVQTGNIKGGTPGTETFTVEATTGNTLVGGTLDVTGPTTFTGAVTAKTDVTLNSDVVGTEANLNLTEGNVALTKGNLTIKEGNIKLGDPTAEKFTVEAATGNTVVKGTLEAGVTTFTGAVTAKEAVAAEKGVAVGLAGTPANVDILEGNLLVQKGNIKVGAPTAEKFTVDADGNTVVKGTLEAGVTTLASATVTGALAANGGITVDTDMFSVADATGNVATKGDLTVDGLTTLNGGVVLGSDASDNIVVKGIMAADGVTGSIAANTAATATTASNIAGGDANKIPIQTGVGVTTFIDAPATGSNKVLMWDDGNGSIKWGTAPTGLTGHEMVDLINAIPDGDDKRIEAAQLDSKVVLDDETITVGDVQGTIGAGLLIQANKVTNAHMADNAINTDEIVDEAVTNAKIKDKAVGTTKLNDQAVTNAKIALGAITGGTGGVIADGSIQEIDIQNGAVTATKLAAGAVQGGTGGVIHDKSITAADLADDAIEGGTNGVIKDGSITSADLAPDAVSAANIKGGDTQGKVLVTKVANGATEWSDNLTALTNLTATGTVILGGTAGNVTLGSATTGTTAINGTATVGKKLTVATEGIEVTAGGLKVLAGETSVKALTADGAVSIGSATEATTIVGAATVGTTLGVSGLLTANGGITVPATGTITANGGIATTTLTASGLVKGAGLESTAGLTVAGTSSFNDAVTVKNDKKLTANGEVELGGESGKVTLGKANTEKTSVLGALEVAQATTLTGLLTANGGITVPATGTITANGGIATTTLTATSLTGKMVSKDNIIGDATAGKVLVSATGTAAEWSNSLTGLDALTATGDVTLGGTSGKVTLGKAGTEKTSVLGALEVDQATTLTGLLTANGGITTTTLTATGATALAGLTVGGASTFNGDVTVADGKAFTANGAVTLGNAAGDAITVNGTMAPAGTGKITANVISGEIVDVANIKTNAVTEAKIADKSVTAAKIKGDATVGKVLVTSAANEASWADAVPKATNLAGTTANTIPYQNGTATAYIAAPTAAGQVLTYSGGALTWAAPTNAQATAPVMTRATVTSAQIATSTAPVLLYSEDTAITDTELGTKPAGTVITIIATHANGATIKGKALTQNQVITVINLNDGNSWAVISSSN